MQFGGRVVLVTGAQQGIGRAMALEFAAAGADVAVNWLDDNGAAQRVAEEVGACGRRAVLVKADVAQFASPQGMVDQEFDQIWQRLETERQQGRLDEDDKDKDEATLRSDYRAIAERRVRLGLLLAEIGRVNNITVAQTPRVLNVRGFPAADISGVRIYDSTFKQIKKPDQVVDADVKLVNCSLEQAAN